jgi:hypothetical protein
MGESVPTTENVHNVLELIAECDKDNIVPAKKKKDVFKKFIGAIIHDMWTMSAHDLYAKWTVFLPMAYNALTKEQFTSLANVGAKRATIESRIAGISENVSRFLDSETIPYDSDCEYDSSDDESDM